MDLMHGGERVRGREERVPRRPTTGPLPSLSWDSLRRRPTLEGALPAVIIGGFVALGLIQLVLMS
jgi:hypothetical protein